MKQPFAKKSFGQNFLVDENYIAKIIGALNLQAGETVVEIGAGRGALTEKLIDSGAQVVAVELERNMISILRGRFEKNENFRLVESDALRVDFKKIIESQKSANENPQTVKLVANLPYNISTAILQKLIEQRSVFSEMILMFQREVVERITAQVGNSERGFLSVLAQAYLQTEKLFDVPPRAFLPAPKVTSAVVRLITLDGETVSDDFLFRRIVSAGFMQKRKTIFNNLKSAPPDLRERFGDALRLLENCNISPERRAETLTIDEWLCLCDCLINIRVTA